MPGQIPQNYVYLFVVGILGLIFIFLRANLIAMLCLFQVCSTVIQLYTYIDIDTVFQILFHYRLLQDTEYINSSMCYTVGPCCLSSVTLFLLTITLENFAS